MMEVVDVECGCIREKSVECICEIEKRESRVEAGDFKSAVGHVRLAHSNVFSLAIDSCDCYCAVSP